jgi:hypothetical protein
LRRRPCYAIQANRQHTGKSRYSAQFSLFFVVGIEMLSRYEYAGISIGFGSGLMLSTIIFALATILVGVRTIPVFLNLPETRPK